jgi:hypothetical protein
MGKSSNKRKAPFFWMKKKNSEEILKIKNEDSEN